MPALSEPPREADCCANIVNDWKDAVSEAFEKALTKITARTFTGLSNFFRQGVTVGLRLNVKAFIEILKLRKGGEASLDRCIFTERPSAPRQPTCGGWGVQIE